MTPTLERKRINKAEEILHSIISTFLLNTWTNILLFVSGNKLARVLLQQTFILLTCNMSCCLFHTITAIHHLHIFFLSFFSFNFILKLLFEYLSIIPIPHAICVFDVSHVHKVDFFLSFVFAIKDLKESCTHSSLATAILPLLPASLIYSIT